MRKLVTLTLALSLILLAASAWANPWKTWVSLDVVNQNGEQVDLVKNRIMKSLDKLGYIVEDSSSLSLSGEIIVIDEQQVDGFDKSFLMLACELTLTITYNETGSSLGSETFESKGGGNSKDEAIKEVYRNYKFSKKQLAPLLERANQKLAEKLEAINKSLLDEGKGLYNQGKKSKALEVLMVVDPNCSSYTEAEELCTKIKNEMWQEYVTKLEHEQKVLAEKTRQKSLIVDSLNAEAMKAEELAKARAEETRTAEAYAKAMRDSLANLSAERQAERERLQTKVKLAEEKSKQMQLESDLAVTELATLKISAGNAQQSLDDAVDHMDAINQGIDGGPENLPDCILVKLAGNTTSQEIMGKWQSGDYTLTLSDNCNFVLTSSQKPKRVAGNYVVSSGKIMKLTPEDSSMPSRQLSYNLNSANVLILEGNGGFSVRFEKVG